METVGIQGVLLTPLKIVIHPKGNILHAMKNSDSGFAGFGEAYFSTVHPGELKGWKKHLRMTLNLVVPVGEIRFVMHDDRESSPSRGNFSEVFLSPQNYLRLTIPPGIWLAFEGVGKEHNLLLNLADLEHDPYEGLNVALDAFAYTWGEQARQGANAVASR